MQKLQKYCIRFKGCEIWNNLPIFIKNPQNQYIFLRKEQKNIILIYYTNILKQIKPFDSF